MTMFKTKRARIALGGLAILLGAIGITTTVAYAGAKDKQNVIIDPVKHIARGAMADARNEAGDQSEIAIMIDAGPKGRMAQVNVTDGKGNGMACQTTAEPMVATLATVPSDAFVQITYGGEDDMDCLDVVVWNASSNRPKTP
jgi:hypothetical protein